jgi:hypothetical protein
MGRPRERPDGRFGVRSVPSPARYPVHYNRLALIPDMRRGMLSAPDHLRPSPRKWEKDHGDHRRGQRRYAPTQTLEQGQADRTETTAAAEARLGHSDAIAARRTHAGTWRSSISRSTASCVAATW